jgi:ribokinase
MQSQVLVVGSYAQDLSFVTARFPSPGETVLGTFESGPGGKGSNQAIAAHRAGADCVFVGAVGEDEAGREIRDFYRAEGLATRLSVLTDAPTGRAGIVRDRSGQNQIVMTQGANLRVGADQVDADLLARARILVCQNEIPAATVRELFGRARAARVTTLLNPAPMGADFPADLLGLTDILVPNETEFATLQALQGGGAGAAALPSDDAELQRQCRRLGPPVVLLTLGEQGVFASTPEEFFRVAAVPGVEVRDTTGAGDAFVGAFATAFAEDPADLAGAVRFANRAAALSVQRVGAAGAMPSREAIEAGGGRA